MVPLAASGTSVIGVVVAGSVALLAILLRMERRDTAEEHAREREAEQERQ
jgi:hypothetical protein